jgi:hypothetical protein
VWQIQLHSIIHEEERECHGGIIVSIPLLVQTVVSHTLEFVVVCHRKDRMVSQISKRDITQRFDAEKGLCGGIATLIGVPERLQETGDLE